MATVNEIKLLYDQYSSFLSAQILDNTLNTISSNISGKLDSCKLLMLIGTGDSTSADFAQLSAGYYRLSIPNNITTNNIYLYFTNLITSGVTITLLSSHFSQLNKNSNLVSDIIKLSFILPVPTSARVLLLLSKLGNTFLEYLKYHDYWPLYKPITENYPTWLDAFPHFSLFNAVSAYINDSLSTHNISDIAHENRFKKYYTADIVESKLAILQTQITNLVNRAEASENNIILQLDLCSSALSTSLGNHYAATNEPYLFYAHKQIFDKYDRILIVNAKDTAVKNELYHRINVHCNNGTNLHKDLAPKLDPQFRGNLYLNYTDNDNNNHALYIKVSKTDFCRIGSFQTESTTDCGGLALQTADNGTLPIVVLQYNGLFINIKNRAYILDKDGNTSFPHNTYIGGAAYITGNLYANGNFIYAKNIEADSINTSRRSYTYLENLSWRDQSKIIPNTLWVHTAITNKANEFCVKHVTKVDNKEYSILTPEIPIPGNNTTTQTFGYVTGITINPALNKITASTFKGATVLSTNIRSSVGSIRIATMHNANILSNLYNNGSTTLNGATTLNNSFTINTNSPAKLSGTLEVSQATILHNTLKVDKNVYIANNTISLEENKITCNEFIGISNKARWADLAEVYLSDGNYPPGTLIQFGGKKLITIATTQVNGVISNTPAYLMNSDMIGQKIALVGRVKVRVKGKVNKFDYITLSDLPGIGISNGSTYTLNTIAKALLEKTNNDLSEILCVIQMHI